MVEDPRTTALAERLPQRLGQVNDGEARFYLIRNAKDEKALRISRPNLENDPQYEHSIKFPQDKDALLIYPLENVPKIHHPKVDAEGNRKITKPMLKRLRFLTDNKGIKSKEKVSSNLVMIKGEKIRTYTLPNRLAEMDAIYEGGWQKTKLKTELPPESGFRQGFPYEVSMDYLCSTLNKDVEGVTKLLPDGTLLRKVEGLEVVLIVSAKQQEVLSISERDTRTELVQFSANPYVATFRSGLCFPYEVGMQVVAAITGANVEHVAQIVESLGLEVRERHLGSSLVCKTREDEIRLLYGVKDVSTG